MSICPLVKGQLKYLVNPSSKEKYNFFIFLLTW